MLNWRNGWQIWLNNGMRIKRIEQIIRIYPESIRLIRSIRPIRILSYVGSIVYATRNFDFL